ncbi:Uncharacterized protein FWK35_00006347 [Aphis craccivora]|uniref:Uncharacterized protein n=1 Tax=Aphis craccivora TaxID=307492 RepID=A0A6G0ZGA3_APHCR|nr:Uncharacterized protein FWK35_00006347 [Aphis craccivora]
MNDSYMNILKNEVLVNLEKYNCDNDSISNISLMFDAINNQYSNLKSEHKRLNVLEDMVVLFKVKFGKKKIINQPNKIILPYFLYFDDYETNNPLGTHAGLKKLGAVYISFTPCFLPEFSSSLNNK